LVRYARATAQEWREVAPAVLGMFSVERDRIFHRRSTDRPLMLAPIAKPSDRRTSGVARLARAAVELLFNRG
jgi:uncharacterized protein YdaU (DUF1376 family)